VPPDAVARLRELGFSARDASALADHFEDADRRGKRSHGVSRIDWLAGLDDLDPAAAPERVLAEEGFERWEARGAVGYLVLDAVVRKQLEAPPGQARVVVAAGAFPTGVLGYWVRRLAEGGLAAALTATSPRRLAHPEGGAPLAGTNPLALGVPSSDGRPLVTDVSMGRVTYGDVLRGAVPAEELVPFGGDQAHKAFALAVGLHAFVDALSGEQGSAVLVVARPESDPVPALRALAGGVRLPGDS
jgi:(2R)-3-sulfolactate dehydrogenase (NADP+)